jgi:membrane fusion protein (multidrug efflux system)
MRQSLRKAIDDAPAEIKGPAKKLLLGAIILFIAISAYKYVSYKIEERRLAAEIAAGPLIRTMKIEKSPGEHVVTTIGETRPYQSVTLYAKVSGYLKSVKVDKGDVVKEGQVLAVIESPETDQAYQAAFADAHNKKDIAARMTVLRQKALVSEQEAEQAQSDADVSAARLHSEATLKGYEILRAPFPGTVTARFADPGALVQNATSSQASALPVVTVAQIRRLRVDVFLDQKDAPFVQNGDAVKITLPERPGVVLEGQVARLADELDPRTKMMLTEIDIPNEDRSLVAGSFVSVSMTIKSPPYYQAPVESLILRGTKTYLTMVTPENTVTYRPADIVTNDGKFLYLSTGVQVGEVVALNIGDSIPEGGKVRPIKEETSATAPIASPSPGASPLASSGTLPVASPVASPEASPR